MNDRVIFFLKRK